MKNGFYRSYWAAVETAALLVAELAAWFAAKVMRVAMLLNDAATRAHHKAKP
jgi:hypothetical protein